jgi:ABC-type uncharacterized transport system substrate-binding protein
MGAVVSLEISPFKMGSQAGQAAVAILSGIPVNRVARMEANDCEVGINKRVALKMGVKISVQSLGGIEAASAIERK